MEKLPRYYGTQPDTWVIVLERVAPAGWASLSL